VLLTRQYGVCIIRFLKPAHARQIGRLARRDTIAGPLFILHTKKSLTLPPLPSPTKLAKPPSCCLHVTPSLSLSLSLSLDPESACHYKINLSQQTSTFLQFESLCYQNIFLKKIVKLGRYLEVKSSLITKENRGYKIFNFTVKLQKFCHFFTQRKLVLQVQGRFSLTKAGISNDYLFSSFWVSTSIFINRCFSRKEGKKITKNVRHIRWCLSRGKKSAPHEYETEVYAIFHGLLRRKNSLLSSK